MRLNFKEDLDYFILKTLKEKNDYVSGEELSRTLKLSRQALFKRINKLIEKGYEIEGVPHLGYRLVSSPDKLYPEEIKYNLKTKFVGCKIHYYSTISSTQDVAWQLEEKKEGTLIVSEKQTKGRGRLNRKWVSGEGGIYFSLILRPQFLLPTDIAQITLLSGLGCVYGIRKSTSVECLLKWPNDILIDEKKVGGILCEVSCEQDKINFVIIGIGINVNNKDLPKEATSIFLSTKKRFRKVEILKSILKEIEELYEEVKKKGFKRILKEWSSFCSLWGNRVKVRFLDKEIEGQAQGIDERGYLILRKDNGLLEKVCAGDVIKINVN
jgi:BirA family biotin operon repressor/biotin-[acetyl-CoA-carboxylase] ligase